MAKEKTKDVSKSEDTRVTARKYRPATFSDVTSQQYITQTLRNAIKNGRISHAYLLTGPRGVGKTTIARLIAKALNCTDLNKETGEPCNQCPSCTEINNENRNHPDVFEIDGASNRNIEDVRELKEKVKYGPVRSRYKIFIIDEVHMLTGASFNALLKTLEEPPRYVVFIFATTAPEKVPLTILGRCQKFDFKRLTIDEITARLKKIADNENIKIDDESLFFIAKKGDGSMRDALGLLDMAAAYSDNNITFDSLKSFFNLVESDVYFNITGYIKQRDGKSLLNYFDELMNRGYDMQTFLDGLTEHYRNLLLVSSTGSSALIMESDTVKQKFEEFSGRFSQIELLNSLKLILQTEYTFKYSANQRTLLEALLVELMKFTDMREISELIDELKDIKSGNEQVKPEKPQAKSYQAAEEKPVINPVYSSPDKEDKQEKAPELPPPVDITASVSDLNSHWTSIKDKIKTERKWVYSILKDTTFGLDGSSNYCIRVDDNRYDLLESYREYITGMISSYFGKQLPVSLVKNSESGKPGTSGHGPENDNYEQLKNMIINELNGKIIEP